MSTIRAITNHERRRKAALSTLTVKLRHRIKNILIMFPQIELRIEFLLIRGGRNTSPLIVNRKRFSVLNGFYRKTALIFGFSFFLIINLIHLLHKMFHKVLRVVSRSYVETIYIYTDCHSIEAFVH